MDRLRTEFMNLLFSQGHRAWNGEKLLASVLFFFPTFSQLERNRLDRSSQLRSSCCQSRRHLCRGADAVSLGPTVQKTIEILQLQFIDKVFDVCCAGPASSRVQSERRAPTVAARRILAWTRLSTCPLMSTTDARWFRSQKTVNVQQLQYFLNGWSISLLCRSRWRSSSRSSPYGGYGGGMWVFGVFSAIFALLQVVWS